MTMEDAFLADIRENPDEDAPWLIYADWLTDRAGPADADRAEFIRVQVAAARGPADAAAEQTRLSALLLERHWDAWTAPLWKILGNVVVSSSPILRFQRGFIHELTLDTGVFLMHARALVEMAPIGRLRLFQAGGHGPRLSGSPSLARLGELEFVDYYRGPFTAPDMLALAKSPYLTNLRALRLQRNNLGDTGAQALAGAGWLGGLMALDLTDNGLSADGVAALAQTRQRFRPLWLNLSHNLLGDRGGRALAGSPLLSDVHWLDLTDCDLDVDSMEALAAANLAALRHLDLSRNAFSNGCARRLAAAPWLPGLTRLILRNHHLSHEGLAMLAPHLAGRLVLS